MKLLKEILLMVSISIHLIELFRMRTALLFVADVKN